MPASSLDWNAVMWWLTAVSIAGCLALLYMDGRRNEQAVRRDWDMLLTPRGRRAYEDLKERVDDDLALADLALGRARDLRRLGSVDEALEVLEAGYALVERFSPSMRTLLAGVSVFSRMVVATAPVRPLRPLDFRVARLASLASLNGVLHAFLVTTAERFRLRGFMLRRGFATATRFMFDAKQRLVRHQGRADEAWDAVEAARQDLHRLSDEALESFRTLLLSLSAERKEPEALPIPDRWLP
jgi:hypothetical protein